MILPMFPLGSVLLPHQPLPLHVFEERYRVLVRHCLEAERGFGVVLIERGHEVGGGDVRFDIGCSAEIVQADELPDGRWGIVASGVQPLRVIEWLSDDPYPRADVELVDDPPWTDADESAFDDALDGFRRVVALAREVGYDVDPAVLELPGEAAWDHWILAGRAPVGDLDRLALLGAEGPEQRLRLLQVQLGDVEAVLASRLAGG